MDNKIQSSIKLFEYDSTTSKFNHIEDIKKNEISVVSEFHIGVGGENPQIMRHANFNTRLT